ncbi:EAL domain-containing protein [Butyrivibrio sp. CB08]|uniref:EAL domain-containing protein n=1 Tax=Butyrivibrio sp. CB08 TaxID=2364879 RepID=UPI000EA9FCE5|nr:EAL domain-containing protein [Butyrivibrio sp. CB08]RKM62109.1 EAL domain-containing protein [Butyrivibrio sp. CB08]
MSPSVKQYVADNIDKALESGWIKVYYQPVIRSLTEQLCGAESLARWIDPDQGFLPPDKFIGTLENTRQIHKLDMYIIEQVCKDISERLSNKLPTVPVSVNFSRLDFEEVDMVGFVEGLVSRYDIPRDYIHIEITESMIVSDADLMRRMIDDFRDAGYEVWMDDFGSGYSSLNLLKDYHFDTLKLDMEFLRNFNDKSKAIMTSTTTMAKDIDMATLAEGVETAEQVSFLRNIGCGKLQGYFYGKPMPIDEFFDHIEKQNIGIEERKWRHFYDVASINARETDEPLEILEDDGKEFKTLFMNEPYMRQIFSETSSSLETTDEMIYHTPSPLLKKYRNFADTLEKTRNQETFYYTINGNIYRFSAKVIAENEGRFLIKGTIHNISTDQSVRMLNSVDSRLKELNHLFDNITQINPSADSIMPLLGRSTYQYRFDANAMKLTDFFALMEKEVVSSADKKRFHEFTNVSTISERVKASEKGYLEDYFRIKQQNGQYMWSANIIMAIPGTGGKEFLLCARALPENVKDIMNETKEMFRFEDYGLESAEMGRYTKLFMNFAANSTVKFFWKDKDRNFVGASQAFLDFFKISSIDDLRGKPSEKQSWSVDKKRSIKEDTEILTKGAKVENAPSQYIIDGVIHNTICNKMPVYENGKIIGVMGYLVDIGEELSRMDSFYHIDRFDKITGRMTIRSFLNTMVDYSVQYTATGADYGLIILRNTNHDRIAVSYGQEVEHKVLKAAGDQIVEVTGNSCAVARNMNSDFILLTHVSELQELDMIAAQLKEKLEGIKSVDGYSVTIKIQTGTVLRSEEGIIDENILYTAISRLK